MLGEPEAGDAADGQQGEVLIGIVDDPEQVHHVLDLLQLVVLGVRVRIDGDARLLQGSGIDARPARHAAQQDHDVPIAVAGLQRLAGGALLHQGLDALHDKAGLPGGAVLDPLLLARLLIGGDQQVHLGLRAVGRVRTGLQGRRLVVFDLQGLRPHGVAEHLVDRGQHVLRRPEVLLQQDLPFPLSRREGIAGILVHEQPRVRLAEAVDALLHVAHQEELVVPVQGLDDLLLDGADVLVFVDEQRVEGGGELRGHPLLPEQPQAEVLQVAVVQHVLFVFELHEPVLDGPGQLHEAPGQLPGRPVVLQGLAVVAGQGAHRRLHLSLEAVPQIEVGLLPVLVIHVSLFAPGHGRKFDVPAPQQALVRGGRIFLQQGPVSVQRLFKPGGRARVGQQVLALVQGALRLFQLPPGHLHEQPEGG